ncbi:protein BLISTER isoform X2 [Brachypodium distachyon]|uniref:Uncharacterized protein n=1 Tax=Brachypodium distachyon TaxID=15368 RepID=A0A0Q3KJ23_BRADI|nr:protein BLISTER isoform X2 [Brachypodium distachyon]KQK11145.1 hypothetical protein BRADI_2g58397v3 [Brachypodium distachyon]|eukprot:XP_024314925.1 protein BLISTER isoform X2 [Brachypodium distachyon]
MASAPAPSSSSTAVASSREASRQAGKKALEEFRKKKKKAAKKAAPVADQATPAVSTVVDTPLPNANNLSAGAGLVSDVDSSIASTSSVPSASYDNGPISSSRGTEYPSNTPVVVNASASVSNVGLPQDAFGDGGSKFYGNLSFSDLVNGHHEDWRGNATRNRVEFSPDKDAPLTSKPSAFGNTNSGSHPAEVLSNWGRNSSLSQVHGTEQSSLYSSSSLFGKSERTYSQDYSPENDIFGRLRATSKDSFQVDHSAYASNREYGSSFDSSKTAVGADHDTNIGMLGNASGSTPANFDKEDPFLSTAYPTTHSRSRPSFLDSIGVQRAPPSQVPYAEPSKANNTLFSNSNSESSSFQQPNQQSTQSNGVDNSVRPGRQEYHNEKEPYDTSKDEQSLQHGNHMFQNFTTHDKDDGFATLEQLIEDLTTEKFSLQRTLEKSQELAQTLATDNSALTDKFNQQAHVISQLTSDIERLQDEIQAQLALKLRSNELKLEKEVQGLNSEISSYRRKVSSLEKERQHLQSTVEALQEEKKLLYSKLRNIPMTEKVDVIQKPPDDKKDASTATEDLDTGESSSSETMTTIDTLQEAETSVLQANNMYDFPSFGEVSSSIPVDQLRMIDNINSLMSELAVEREELMRALRIESSNCSKLKELNKDLTHKLEIQTQRLELLTSQRMANENGLARQIDTRSIDDATLYADEGDEVVDRVLGWIMKLFPGGPKRRTSKLL